MRAFISAGHYDDPARTGEEGARDGGFTEFSITQSIADAVAVALRDVAPALVPSVVLQSKIQYVNRWSQPGDVAVEVHLNAGPPDVRGCESFFYSGSRRGQTLAEDCVIQLRRFGLQSRGAKQDTESQHGRLAWVRDTKPWAALVEVEFLTNADARAWLLDEDGIRKAGKAIAQAIDRMA